MSEEQVDRERPCLHCIIVELIDDFFAENPPVPSGSDKVDTEEADELIEAIAKTVAELISKHDAIFRQHLIDGLMRDIVKFVTSFAGKMASTRSEPMCGIEWLA